MYVADENIILMSDIKQETMDYEKLIQDLDLQNENIYEEVPINGTRKRMRLHQLSWEEKLQRKKLRNRIAAQTSRDRKKAKMDYLEESLKQLKEQNGTLILQVEELKIRNEALLNANQELQKELTERNYTCSCYSKSTGGNEDIFDRDVEVQAQSLTRNALSSKRPAESFCFPQQKGQRVFQGKALTKMTSLKLLKIFLLYLLSQKCWKISKEKHSSMTLKNWQQVCWKKLNSMDAEKILNQHLWRYILEIPEVDREECINDIEMVGPTSEVMESSRESSIESQCPTSGFKFSDLTLEDQICLISFEHSYACGIMLEPQDKKTSSESQTPIPDITITEPVKTQWTDNSDYLTSITSDNDSNKESEKEFHKSELDSLDVPFFPNFCSPKSEASSDLGYESHGSPYENDLSNSFGDLFNHGLSELFPELM